MRYQYRYAHTLYRPPIPVAGRPRAKPSAEFRARRSSRFRPDPRAPASFSSPPSPRYRSVDRAGFPPSTSIPRPTVSNASLGERVPEPRGRRPHDRTVRGRARAAQPEHRQPVHRPASGEAPVGRDGECVHGGGGENAAATALEPRLHSARLPPTSKRSSARRSRSLRRISHRKHSLFSRLTWTDCGTSGTGCAGNRAGEASGSERVASGVFP